MHWVLSRVSQATNDPRWPWGKKACSPQGNIGEDDQHLHVEEKGATIGQGTSIVEKILSLIGDATSRRALCKIE